VLVRALHRAALMIERMLVRCTSVASCSSHHSEDASSIHISGSVQLSLLNELRQLSLIIFRSVKSISDNFPSRLRPYRKCFEKIFSYFDFFFLEFVLCALCPNFSEYSSILEVILV
jgi:hypothetical protein